MTGRKRKGRGTKNVPLLLIALPGLAYLLINNYIPMFGIFLAFKSYDFSKGVFGSPWCGFDNFKFLFKTKDALIMTRNTILYNFAFIVIGTALGIFVAILLTEIVKSVWAKFYQSALLLPYLLSWVVISYMVFAFLNSDSGFINNTVLKVLGMAPVSWYTKSNIWPFILILVFYGRQWAIRRSFTWPVLQVLIKVFMKLPRSTGQVRSSRSFTSHCHS